MKKIDIRKIIHVPYYYVPKCPECGSPMTGRYVHYNTFDSDNNYVIDSSLRHGEIVDFLPEVNEVNAFCMTCGNKWKTNVEFRLLTLDEIREEKAKRHTNELLKARIEEQKRDKKRGFLSKILW